MFNSVDFLNLLGWADWVNMFLVNEYGENWTFADLVFNTLPCVLQLFLIVFFLNWIMGIIGDCCKAFGGRRGGL